MEFRSPYITLVRHKIQNTDGLNIRCKCNVAVRYACSPLGCVTACVVYGRFDSKIGFENESDGRFDLRFDSNEKKRFAGP